MSESHLLYEKDGAVARITINREERRNALSPEAMSLFLQHLDTAEADDEVRVVLVTAKGQRAFCAGADLSSGMGSGSAEGMSAFRDFASTLKRLAGFPKPTVARVNGSCVAGGTGIMLACDVVYAVDTAKFGTPEVNVGLFPMMIGALIFRNAPRKKAMEMMLMGKTLTAPEALELGMITRFFPPDALDGAVEEALCLLAGKSPIGMRIGKSAFHKMADMPFEQALDFLSEKLAEVASTEDAVEGITAYLQ
ncbi:MAG: enoyl-CoA hydratase/isomerase family protein, partial [Proteobacteria bacterium]|nr:enoyl-CoA hydratase/isomerase family protein [Pseudomonadota bacterium]